MAGRMTTGWVIAFGAVLALAGCEDGQPFGLTEKPAEGEVADGAVDPAAEGAAPAARGTTRIVERDVEAPQVFSVSEAGLWDGRPSLGGVWVAYPSVKDPERVIIRNPANGKFVIGALFRRERDMPGPRLQVSSDAAAALGLLAGQPVELSATALRREEVREELPGPARPILDTSEQIATETLGAPTPAIAATAIPAPGSPVTAPPSQGSAAAPAPTATAAAPPPARPAATAPAAAGGRNLLQIGIFSVEGNAKRAADQLKKADIAATIKREESQGKVFWRVLAGPAANAAGRKALQDKAKGLGYPDAYFVSR
jgi:cell division septation protein DedD